MAKPMYKVWVVNLVTIGDTVTAPDGSYTKWTQALLDDTCAKLKGLFDLTCNHSLSQFSSTDVTPASLATVSSSIKPGELLVRLTTKKASIILQKYGASKEASGGTVDTQGNGVVSECWIESSAGSVQYTPLIARLAFHELMHNKYDAMDSNKNLHTADGTGLTVGGDSPNPVPIAWDTPLTESNKRLMAPLLGKMVTQCTLTKIP
jgi:hypothetical protein